MIKHEQPISTNDSRGDKDRLLELYQNNNNKALILLYLFNDIMLYKIK